MDGSNLVCSFTRANRLVNTSDYFDLNNKYYVLLARGPASGIYKVLFSKSLKFPSTCIINRK